MGDGITDLEAVQESGGADLFIGYGGVVKRQVVLENADWFIYDFKTLTQSLLRYQVAMIGSGAWACAAAKLVASNVAKSDRGDKFAREVRMWVYDEVVDGKNLSSIINEQHENVKYLPGVPLGENLVAHPSLKVCCLLLITNVLFLLLNLGYMHLQTNFYHYYVYFYVFVRGCLLQEAVKDATIIIFCAPHQFIGGIVKQMRGLVRRDAIAVSLTKV